MTDDMLLATQVALTIQARDERDAAIAQAARLRSALDRLSEAAQSYLASESVRTLPVLVRAVDLAREALAAQ